ncbi:hypothetical protein L6452_34689 [Arctium lappa]|uniref:Uncharacterized protein n=1 Tax=Arctium lappa TaxID=4217 RepID=A0ACB8YI94_ARCLA|nr:hypothetical protein L6452_34689 [Arctium lappa]
MRLLRAGSGVEGDEVAALAERRQSLARWEGLRPVILRSTFTILLDLFGLKGEKKRSGDNGEVKIWRMMRRRLWQRDGGVR